MAFSGLASGKLTVQQPSSNLRAWRGNQRHKNEIAECRARGCAKPENHPLPAFARASRRPAQGGIFRSFGFKLEAWEELASALLNHARHHEVAETVPTPFGRVIEGALPSPDGRSPKARGVWFIASGEEIATLATAYPLDE